MPFLDVFPATCIHVITSGMDGSVLFAVVLSVHPLFRTNRHARSIEGYIDRERERERNIIRWMDGWIDRWIHRYGWMDGKIDRKKT